MQAPRIPDNVRIEFHQNKNIEAKIRTPKDRMVFRQAVQAADQLCPDHRIDKIEMGILRKSAEFVREKYGNPLDQALLGVVQQNVRAKRASGIVPCSEPPAEPVDKKAQRRERWNSARLPIGLMALGTSIFFVLTYLFAGVALGPLSVCLPIAAAAVLGIAFLSAKLKVKRKTQPSEKSEIPEDIQRTPRAEEPLCPTRAADLSPA